MRTLDRPKIATTADLIQDTNWHVAFYPEIYVQGELLQIPYRTYCERPGEERTGDLTAAQQLILACWMSRHHDGRVRQQALSLVLEANAPWTIPFVIQLCGEYVIEIGSDVLTFVTTSLPERPALRKAYAVFVHETPNSSALQSSGPLATGWMTTATSWSEINIRSSLG